MSTPRPWKLTRRLAMVKGEERIAQVSARLKPDLRTPKRALVFDAAGRLRSALRLPEERQEEAWTLVAESYVLLRLLLENEE